MKEKKTVLVKVYHLIEVDEEELVKEGGLLDNVIDEVSNDKILFAGEEVLMKWQGTEILPLLPDIINCGKCANCGAWVTDREKDEPIAGLGNGATVDGKLLCDECLPEGHRWAF